MLVIICVIYVLLKFIKLIYKFSDNIIDWFADRIEWVKVYYEYKNEIKLV
jgi:hypothetical protein